jgi:N-acetylglucosamine-6-phosphate deacetylase
VHLEGPYLNPAKKGAHNPAFLRAPNVDEMLRWADESVRIVTLAPELPGALDAIKALRARGIVVSAGHSNATYEQARAGFDAGLGWVTHLFNAMRALGHREPGLPGATLTSPVPCGMIVDGIHTHPSIVKLAWQALGPNRLNLVTDAMAALGMPYGQHLLGDFRVSVDDSGARLADGTLAGSTLSLDQALRNLIAFTGCGLSAALATITTTPARALGLSHERGRIEPGYVADMVLLSSDLRVRATIVGGQVVFWA